MPMHSFVCEIRVLVYYLEIVQFKVLYFNITCTYPRKHTHKHTHNAQVEFGIFASTFNSFESVEMVEIVCAFMCAVSALLLDYNSCQLLGNAIVINRMTKLKVWWYVLFGLNSVKKATLSFWIGKTMCSISCWCCYTLSLSLSPHIVLFFY